VVGTRKNLAFGVKLLRPIADLAAHQFNRYLLFELAVGAFGAVDLAHAAAAKEFDDPVCSNPDPRSKAAARRFCVRPAAAGREIKDRILAVHPREQCFELTSEVSIAA